MKKGRERDQLIELRHLRYFITLAEELHFARAAERLRIEQSPLSRAIREMERILGVRLFERDTRSTRITRAGTVLLDDARRVIALVEHARLNARSAALGHGSHLRIGVSDCMAYCWTTEALADYRTANPDILLSLHEMPLQQQIGWIREGLLDASISLDGRDRNGIEAQAVARDAICVIVPAAHPLADIESVLSADLVRHPLILFSVDSDLGADSEIDNFVETLGRTHVAFRANSLGTMLSLVALGYGIGLVGSAQMVGVRRRDVVLRPIGGVVPSLSTYVLHSSCGVSEPLQTFIEQARERLSNGGSTGVLS